MRDDALIRDPAEAAAHVVRMVVDRVIVARSGKRIPCEVQSLCVHGDEPTTLPVARAAREALKAAGVKVVTVPELRLSPPGGPQPASA
jgi:UPF0271 protein